MCAWVSWAIGVEVSGGLKERAWSNFVRQVRLNPLRSAGKWELMSLEDVIRPPGYSTQN